MKPIHVFFCVAICFGADAAAQSPMDLEAAYSGKLVWEPNAGRMTFASSGVIDFGREIEMSGIWTVPPEVKLITIAAKTRVTGQLTVAHDCTIEGRDQMTSVLHGTDTPGLLHDKGLDGGGRCMPYSAVYAKGRIEVTVRNLTTLNPVAYMWTGVEGARLHLEGVRGIDDRGGWSNHSDGIQAARGSTVRNCHLETGDDAIKVYNDILVEDATIRMIQNCVPIQLGWGSYGDGATGTFRNLTIIGDHGRSRTPPVIEGTAGTYRKTIVIEGLKLENPKAALVRLRDQTMELDLTISDGDIAVKQFSEGSRGTIRSSINGSPRQTNRYRPK